MSFKSMRLTLTLCLLCNKDTGFFLGRLLGSLSSLSLATCANMSSDILPPGDLSPSLPLPSRGSIFTIVSPSPPGGSSVSCFTWMPSMRVGDPDLERERRIRMASQEFLSKLFKELYCYIVSSNLNCNLYL